MKQDLPVWKSIAKKVLWEKWMKVVVDDIVLPDGTHSEYVYHDSRDGAGVLLYDRAQDEFLVSMQYRYPINKWIYDMPGGLLDAHDSPEQAVAREALEEVGITLTTVVSLCKFAANPTRANWYCHLFFCDTFTLGERQGHVDLGEDVRIVRLKRDELVSMIHNNEIVDPSLLLAFYTAQSKGLIKL
jgi:ADP-ribose pyrophosphatase